MNNSNCEVFSPDTVNLINDYINILVRQGRVIRVDHK